jgi:hypothetical protein
MTGSILAKRNVNFFWHSCLLCFLLLQAQQVGTASLSVRFPDEAASLALVPPGTGHYRLDFWPAQVRIKKICIDLSAVSFENFLFTTHNKMMRYRECHLQTTHSYLQNFYSPLNCVAYSLAQIITSNCFSGTLRSTPGRLGLSHYPQVSFKYRCEVASFFRSKCFQREYDS